MNNTPTNKLVAYTMAEKFVKSFFNQAFFVLIMLSIIAVGQLIIDPTNSLLLRYGVDLYQWVNYMFLPIIVLSLIYSSLVTPIEILSKSMFTTDSGLRTSEGLLFVKNQTVPYEAIEEVVLEETTLQKIFGFAKLSIGYREWTGNKFYSIPKKQALKLMKNIASKSANSRIHSVSFSAQNN